LIGARHDLWVPWCARECLGKPSGLLLDEEKMRAMGSYHESRQFLGSAEISPIFAGIDYVLLLVDGILFTFLCLSLISVSSRDRPDDLTMFD
jgi:hypothetical protein